LRAFLFLEIPMPWTDDRIAILRKLWNEGHSASIIAGNLGEFSRNAVIGKARRLGLASRRDSPVLRRNARKPALFAARSRSPKARLPPFLPRRRRAQEGQQAKPALKIEASARPIAEPSCANNVTIEGLTRLTCRWPLGDPKTSSFRYCGGPSKPDCSYCAYHAEIAYRRG
jgi:GcrA cell cycle regulator